MFTALTVLVLFSTYGFGAVGLIVVAGYLLLWEVVGAVFSSAEKGIPRPLRILWRILQEIVEIITPSP